MLEGCIARLQKPAEVAMDATVGVVPVLDENRIVADCKPKLVYRSGDPAELSYVPLEDRLPRAAALLPWTSMLGE